VAVGHGTNGHAGKKTKKASHGERLLGISGVDQRWMVGMDGLQIVASELNNYRSKVSEGQLG
jgi:hypothetical protein